MLADRKSNSKYGTIFSFNENLTRKIEESLDFVKFSFAFSLPSLSLVLIKVSVCFLLMYSLNLLKKHNWMS